MPKEYTYRNIKTAQVIFQSVEANYVSKEQVDLKVREKTGHDPRLERHLIECQIRVINERETKSIGRYDKNKRISH
jgi:hypothetical protein